MLPHWYQSRVIHTSILISLWTIAFSSPIIFSIIVFVVGLMTPGYSHINHTISRLAIEKYGWIQELNFIQFAFGIIITGFLVRRTLTDQQSKKFWLVSTLFSAMALIIVSLFPTDPIENVRFSIHLLSYSGLIHFSILGLLLILSPFGIKSLSQTLVKEKDFANLARFTSTIGYLVSLLCFIWIGMFIGGYFLESRGIFQKIIASLCIFWLLRMLLVIRKVLLQ
jgi:hypothetical protein